MAHPNTKEKFIVPLSDSLTSKESSLSFCMTCFLLILMICNTVSEEIPYLALERKMRGKER
jgi:hypothetical protein